MFQQKNTEGITWAATNESKALSRRKHIDVWQHYVAG